MKTHDKCTYDILGATRNALKGSYISQFSWGNILQTPLILPAVVCYNSHPPYLVSEKEKILKEDLYSSCQELVYDQ